MGWEEFLDDKFKLTERGSSIGIEVRAGTTTFLTMAYILLVNPHIMGSPNTGIDPTSVVVGTAFGSALASFITGWFANLPFGCAPGLGLSAYLSFGLVKGAGMAWEEALCCCFVSGLIMLILAATNLSDQAMKWIPTHVKQSTVVGMGLLLTFIGMQSIHLVVAADSDSLVKLGDMGRVEIWLSLFGLMVLATLSHHEVKGGVVIGILLVTVIIWTLNDTFPHEYVQIPFIDPKLMYAATDLSPIFNNIKKFLPGIGAFLLVGIFDVSGVMFGLACLAGLQKEDAHGHVTVPNSKTVFMSVAFSSMVAAVLGCSPIIVHIESAVGITQVGAKTGLSSLVISMWFLLAIFLAPLLGSIPTEATAPVIILIGASMMGQATEINWENMKIAIPSFLTLSLMPFSFSIPNGIAFGLMSNMILSITCRDWFGKKESQFYDELSNHSHTGGPITGSSLTYGTSSAAAGGHHFDATPPMRPLQRIQSENSFVRSPNLFVRETRTHATPPMLSLNKP